MRSILKTLLLSLLVGSIGIHTAIAQKQTIICNTSTGAACNTTSNPGDGTQGEPAWLFNGKSNVNFDQIFTMLGPTGTLPAPLYGVQFNNNGTIGSLIPGSTGTWCLDWPNLSAPPSLVSCGSGSGTVTSVGVTVPTWLSVSPSTITTSGTFSISGTVEPNNEVLASAASGSQTALAPRALVAADIPTISASTGLSGTLQAAQFPGLLGDITNTSGTLSMTVGKVNGLPIPPSAGLIGTNSSSQFVAVTTPLSVALGGTGTASPALVPGSNVSITGTWPNQTINASATNSLAFSGLTSATNTQMTSICGTGCSLSATGSGAINATNTVDVNGATVPASALVLGSNSLGQLVFQTTTGTGFPVLATSPTLTTPALGAATATSINGTAIPNAATLLVSGGALGTPSSATLTNATGLPTTGLTGTLQAAQEPAHTGDMTNTAGSLATTVVRVNGGSLPISASVLGTNSIGQIVVGSAGGGGTVTTTGTPAAGNLAAFSGSTAITNSNLSGDVTTAGTLAATVVKVNGASVPVSALVLGSNSSGQLVSETTTGTGNNVLSISPALVTPALGTPSALVLTNATGLPNASVIGLGTFATANSASPPAIGGTTPAAASFSTLTDTGVTGVIQCLHVNTAGLISGTGSDCGSGGGSSAFASITGGTNTTAAMLVGTGASIAPAGSGTVTANALSSGIALGTPASGTLTNAAGLPLSTGVTGTLLAAQFPALSGDATTTSGSLASTVHAINGVALSGLATGILKNTTTTGVPSIAIAADFPTLNQSTSGNAATATALAATPTQCGGSTFATGITAAGNANCSTPAGGGNVSNVATPTSGQMAQWTSATTIQGIAVTGTGSAVLATSPTLVTPVLGVATATSVNGTTIPASATLLTNGGALGTPSSATLTSATGLPISTGVSGLGTGVATFLATPSSANLAAAITDETGTGANVFATSPTLVTPAVKGSSTGVTTIASANAGASNFTATVPAATDTIVELAQTQTLTNKSIAASEVNSGQVAIANGGTGAASLAAANIATFTTANPVSGHCPQFSGTTGLIVDSGAACGGGSSAFSALTTGSNSTATMTLATGSTLTVSGTGVNNANQVNGATVPASAAILASNSSSQATAVTLGNNFTIASGVLSATQPINAQVGTSYAMLTTDAGKLVTFSNASAVAVSLSVATTSGFTAGYAFDVQNLGAGTVTITPTTSTINGSATLVIAHNFGCTVTSDGTNYQVSACTALASGASLSTANTWTALQTFGTNISIGGVTATGATGTGNNVFATSPALTTPNLGTPSAATLTNATGLPISTGVSGLATGMAAYLAANTTFTIAATGCTPSAHAGGAFGGTITLATGPCTSIIVTMNGATGYTAAHGFDCSVDDQTTQAAGTWIPKWGQSASSTTTATIPIPTAAGATDVISFSCSPN